ncbi:MAG: molybdopterin-synthase adenylyltransferase MoeB [Candidatus Sumerlaeia bacterium]|nr:molybdopterin-synthase adenylyltransferase MoeB [Candidatus Sumerlaeia bacterium]
MAPKFTPQQTRRYARHIILPQVGGAGQRRLLDSRVCIVGAGGLGSPVISYLAAAGVGTLVVIDNDSVEESNLQRQVIHGTADLGTPKVESVRRSVEAINPDIRVETHHTRLEESNAVGLLSGVDVVVDGSDNFPTRYLVNETTHQLGIPLVSGAMFRFEGQVTVFPQDGKPDSPCYRCLYPKPPAPGMVPSCAEAGILGCVPGVMGSIQATEVIKLLLGIGDSLVGRLLVYDALEMSFRTIQLGRDPACSVNGDNPSGKSAK